MNAIALAAAPVFAAMALLSGGSGGAPDILCGHGGASPLAGMPLMYGLMAAVHLGPWLRLVARR